MMVLNSIIYPFSSSSTSISNTYLPNFIKPSLQSTTPTAHNFISRRSSNSSRGTWTPRKVSSSSSSSKNNQSAVIIPSQSVDDNNDDATEVVRRFYAGINGRDLASVELLIAEKCVYEDLIFPRPFLGRKAILEFFKSFIDSISKDLQFVIDDISTEDSSAIGVTWHLEWRGKPFPFSRGCSFYKLEMVDGKNQIIYGRDVVEPAIKPGEAALGAIRAVTWLLQQFPQLADQL